MRVLICGSRTWADVTPIAAVVRELAASWSPTDGTPVLIHGDARGADTIARNMAIAQGQRAVKIVAFPADWDRHGKAAGHIRNQQMLDEGRPDVVWAFVDKPLAESVGTANMVERARKAGVPAYVTEKIS